MSWADDLAKLTTKGGSDLGELAQAIKIELFSGVVLDTRVDTGRLRGNWSIQENTPALGVLDREDKSGQMVLQEVAAESTPSGLTYFTNNLPYAEVYEEKDAMVTTNVIRIKANVAKMAREIKG